MKITLAIALASLSVASTNAGTYITNLAVIYTNTFIKKEKS